MGVLLSSALSSDKNCMSDQSTCPLTLVLCPTFDIFDGDVDVGVVADVVSDDGGVMVGGWSWIGWTKNASWVAGACVAVSGSGLTELEDCGWWE